MLIITQIRITRLGLEKKSITYWHTGEPLPKITSRVVTFQADGDELEVILSALKGERNQTNANH